MTTPAPKNALPAINLQLQESNISIELNDPEESSEGEPMFIISKKQHVDLTMQSELAFRP